MLCFGYAVATLVPDAINFWSSTGSADEDRDEWLLYELAYPLNVVSAISLHDYRATFQLG